jgi:hypothetical protein
MSGLVATEAKTTIATAMGKFEKQIIEVAQKRKNEKNQVYPFYKASFS